MNEPWRQKLRKSRRDLGVSQVDLAKQSRVSVDAIRAWETGRRRPSRSHLTRVLDALKIAQLDRNEILSGAGFASDGLDLTPSRDRRVLSLDEARAEITNYRWPTFVVTDMVEIIAANDIASFLFGFDPADPALSPADRHPMSYATTRLAERIVNWDEVAVGQIAAWKAHVRGGESLDHPSAYFAPVVERILAGDASFVTRFVDLWHAVPGQYPDTYRWPYRIDWREPGYGDMRFQCFAWVVNEQDGLDVDDWIPLDPASWETLERIRAGRRMA